MLLSTARVHNKFIEECLETRNTRVSKQNKKLAAIKRLQSLPNIGPAIAERLYSIGIETPEKNETI